jgi:GDPmannose 4,6-dehydratase
MLQLDRPDDFVIATAKAHSIQEWVEEAFAVVNLKPDAYVVKDPALLRPSETTTLIGDIAKARRSFGFDPKFKFKELVRMMVEADVKAEQAAS